MSSCAEKGRIKGGVYEIKRGLMRNGTPLIRPPLSNIFERCKIMWHAHVDRWGQHERGVVYKPEISRG